MSTIIQVALLPDLLPTRWCEDATLAVVIDTLRFTTTACQALAVGANQVTVVAEVESARAAKAAPQQASSLLCGERECRPIPGFDLGNSPYEYSQKGVGGRDLIFTTTNGTLAVKAAAHAPQVLLAALVNCSSVAQFITESVGGGGSVWILCSGTDGEVAGEDVLAAGAILAKLRQIDPAVRFGNDAAHLAAQSWQAIEHLPDAVRRDSIVEAFRQFRGGSNLIENSFAADLDFAADIDALSVVPVSLPNRKDTFVVKR